jgi:hypothetical protein
LSLVEPFVALRLHPLAHLSFEDLIEDALQELGELVVAGKEAVQRLLIQGTAVLGHVYPLSGCSGGLDNTQSTREAPPSSDTQAALNFQNLAGLTPYGIESPLAWPVEISVYARHTFPQFVHLFLFRVTSPIVPHSIDVKLKAIMR